MGEATHKLKLLKPQIEVVNCGVAKPTSSEGLLIAYKYFSRKFPPGEESANWLLVSTFTLQVYCVSAML